LLPGSHAHSKALIGWIPSDSAKSFRQWSENINLIFLADILEALEIGRYRFA
jgi:hypothetical protein